MLVDAQKNASEGKEKGAEKMADFCAKQHPGEKLTEAEAKNSKDLAIYNKNKEAGKKADKKEDAPKEEEKKEDAPAAAAEDAPPAAAEEPKAAEEAPASP